MCGLAGLAVPGGGMSWDPAEVVDAMASALDHRGPDDEGLWRDEDAGVFLGFRRLSILDLSEAGHQPMVTPSGRYVVVFNGEIYNFQELRAELAGRGRAFVGGSDTEVLLGAVECWGVERAIRRFRGMFAFALFDVRERVLWLARDRLGIKPLYLLSRDGAVAFASEARAFHRCPLFSGTASAAAARRFLRLLYVPGPGSILDGVEKIRPGELRKFQLTRSGAREADRIRYWDLPRHAADGQKEYLTDPEDVVERLHDVLRESVRLRLVADVPVGAFLSGGVDSSLIVALMQELSEEKVRTFTIAFDDPRYDEGPSAAEIARHLDTAHTTVQFRTADVQASIPAIPEMCDEPMANPSLLPTLLVSRVARRSVVVALSGDGGDELFGGYNRYLHGVPLIRNAFRIPTSMRRVGATLLRGLAATGASDAVMALLRPANVAGQHASRARMNKLERVLLAPDEEAAYESLLEVGMIEASPPPAGVTAPTMRESFWKGSSLEERMFLRDQSQYLPDDLLTKVDRASMWESLEARVPLLDHHVVEFSWRIPPNTKIRDGVTKWPLRAVAERYVPTSLLDRPKMGFTVPIERWLRSGLREWSRDTLHSDSGGISRLVGSDRMDKMWNAFDGGRDDLAMPLWAATMLAAWSQAWKIGFR